MSPHMDITDADRTLIAAVFEQAALRGWPDVSIADAARSAGVPLDEARARFPGRGAVLLRFGVMADQAALANVSMGEAPRERLFDMLMLRFDVLQQHRGGVLALLASLRTDPGTGLLLYGATLRSMKWLLDAAVIPATGVVGGLRVHGLLALWLYALRAWENDVSLDLSATMAAVDRGLDRAMQAEASLPGHRAGTIDGSTGADDAGADDTGNAASPAEQAAEVFKDAGLMDGPPADGPDAVGPDAGLIP